MSAPAPFRAIARASFASEKRYTPHRPRSSLILLQLQDRPLWPEARFFLENARVSTSLFAFFPVGGNLLEPLHNLAGCKDIFPVERIDFIAVGACKEIFPHGKGMAADNVFEIILDKHAARAKAG